MHFLGPLYHKMSPSGNLHKKPKLIMLVGFMTYIRMAYVNGNIANDIKEAMADKTMNPLHRKHLVNLSALMEFFIPAVNVDVRVVLLGVTAPDVSLLNSANSTVHIEFNQNTVIQSEDADQGTSNSTIK